MRAQKLPPHKNFILQKRSCTRYYRPIICSFHPKIGLMTLPQEKKQIYLRAGTSSINTYATLSIIHKHRIVLRGETS